MKRTPRRITKLVSYERKGLGDHIASAVAPVAKMVGLSDCDGCAKRRSKLNTFGRKVSAFFRKFF